MQEPPDARAAVELKRLLREAQRRGDWQAVLSASERCIAVLPCDPALISWRGIGAHALTNLGRFAEAEAACKALVRDHPDRQAGFAGLARLSQLQRDWPAALARWEACLRRFPASPNAADWRSSQGTALLELGRAAEAEDVFLSLEREYPALPAGRAGRGRVAQSRGDPSDAIRHWDACLERFPDHPLCLAWRVSRARALEQLEAWREAYHAWDELARGADDDVEFRVHSASALLEWRGPGESQDLVATVLARHPSHLGALRLDARIAACRGDTAGELLCYRHCLAFHPDDLESRQRAMDAALRLGDAVAAESLLATAPAAITTTVGFLCRVRLSYFMLRAEIDAGLAAIDDLDEAQLDLPSAAAVARFLREAIRNDRLLGFSRRMLARFPNNPSLVGHHLLALGHVGGEAALAREKLRLLAPLGERQSAFVLGALPPSWLSVAEAKRVLDDRLRQPFGRIPKTHALLHLAARGDNETLAYLADRIGAEPDGASRFLARSLLLAIDDRRRIATANLGGCRWRDFTATPTAIWHELDVLLDTSGDGAPPPRLREALATVRAVARTCRAAWIYSEDSYGDAVSFVAWLSGRVRRAEPTSIVRLNDGEGTFLPYSSGDRQFQTADRRIFQHIWWGKERLAGEPAGRLAEGMLAAISGADAIGIPSPRWLIAHLDIATVRHTVRGLTAVLTCVQSLAPEMLRRKVVVSSHIHTDLEQWDLYRQILAAGSSVSVVSCHDLQQTLAERFGVAVRQWFRIAPEYKYAGMFAATAGCGNEPFYPDGFERIMGSLAPLPGEIFLVAAGFLGKLVCDRVRARGGIGIDVGAVADLWRGHATRWVTTGTLDFDVASSLIAAQPIRDRFVASRISSADPCRSDRTRRLNLTGRFDRFFEVVPASPARQALRVVGHPGCGAHRVAGVLNSLGLDLADMPPGGNGVCDWVAAVPDLNPPAGAPLIRPEAFRATLAYVRDPATAIPAIMLENCIGASFDYRRFHIARRLGIDIARRRDPVERAVASYLAWMRIIDEERPLLTLRVECLLDDLFAGTDVLAASGIGLDWSCRAAAADFANAPIEAVGEFVADEPSIDAKSYRSLPADLAGPLADFCRRHGYPSPAG